MSRKYFKVNSTGNYFQLSVIIICQEYLRTKREIGEIYNNLDFRNQVIVSTDKTNSFMSVSTKQYMPMVYKYLRHLLNKLDIDKVKEIYEKERELVDEIGLQLSKINI